MINLGLCLHTVIGAKRTKRTQACTQKKPKQLFEIDST